MKFIKYVLPFAMVLLAFSVESFAAKKQKAEKKASSQLSSQCSGATVLGTSKSDLLEGEFMCGLGGADAFVLRSGSGDAIVGDFNPVSGDRILFDFAGYSDILFLGNAYDGKVFTNFVGTVFSFHAADVDADGDVDTVIQVNNSDSISILNYSPSQIYGWMLKGG